MENKEFVYDLEFSCWRLFNFSFKAYLNFYVALPSGEEIE